MLTTLSNNEEQPDFIDGVDDFRRHRWEAAGRARQAQAQKKKAEADARAKLRSVWQSDGRDALNSLKKAKAGVNAILGPHLLKKNSGIELLDWVKKFESTLDHKSEYGMSTAFSSRLLYFIRPPVFIKRCKTDLIRWKWVVMSELRRFLDRSKFLTDGAMCNPLTTETKALRKMEYGQRSLVPVPKDALVFMHKNRDEKRFHEEKLAIVQNLLDKWAKVPTCRSLLHSNPSGCPVCEVILLGGTREPMQYVRAINRESGRETMEKLSQELIYLNEEKQVEVDIIRTCEERIAETEKVIFKLARDSIQAWWTVVLARRRSLKEDGSRRKSLYYFRIRRLSRMKRHIDNTIEANLDFSKLRYTYSEIVLELKEYMAKVAADRTELGVKMGKVFLQKLRKAVARTRRKKYLAEEMVLQERAAAQEIVRKKKNAAVLLAMRKLVKTIEKRKFLCIREKCAGRVFFSVERYNAHMSIHKVEDAIRAKKILNDKLQRIRKEQEASTVTERIAAIRQAVFEFAKEHEQDEQQKAKRRIIVDPQSSDLGDGSFVRTSDWNALPHVRIINQEKNAMTYSLHLISKRADIEASAVVTLNQPNMRFGTLPTNECPFTCTGQSKRDGCLSKTHCIISMPSAADYDAPVRVHDNHSTFGTYIVSGATEGAVKVTTSATDGDVLSVGDLLCIGVKKYGAAVLNASEASSACIVYRVKCQAIEGGEC